MISIAIATHNRARELDRTLLALQRLDTTGVDAFEVLVIDNHSSDETSEVVHRLAPAFDGKLHYVYEPTLGLSHARNCAVKKARHDCIAFLDDDVDVDPHWLTAMARAFQETSAAVVGGRAHLLYPVAKPAWLTPRLEGYLTEVERGPVRRPADPDELYGVNLGIRREWFDRVGFFQTDLGRIGGCLLGSEETELLARIAAAGGLLLYEPSAVVAHRVNPSRLRRRWFWSRCYWGHRAETRTPATRVSVDALARATVRLCRAAWRTVRAAVRQGPSSPQCFEVSTTAANCAGTWVGIAERLLRSLPGRVFG